jgi:hypothetical protein
MGSLLALARTSLLAHGLVTKGIQVMYVVVVRREGMPEGGLQAKWSVRLQAVYGGRAALCFVCSSLL